jgi:hypothetical protein
MVKVIQMDEEEYANLLEVQTEPSSLLTKTNTLLNEKIEALKNKLAKVEEDLSVYVIGGAAKIAPTEPVSTISQDDIYLVATYNALNNKSVKTTVELTAAILDITPKQVKHRLRATVTEGYTTRANSNHYTITTKET